jgi:hypothetical protein
MQIYGARRVSSLYDPDSYVGKDVWVRALVKYTRKYSDSTRFCRGFIRLVSSEKVEHHNERNPDFSWTSTTYKINIVDMKQLSRDGAYHCTTERKNDILEYTYDVKSSDYIQILTPIDCRETDELFVVSDPVDDSQSL